MYMYVYVYVYIYIYIHMYTCIYIYIYIHRERERERERDPRDDCGGGVPVECLPVHVTSCHLALQASPPVHPLQSMERGGEGRGGVRFRA